jgi:hypothetical protein
MEGETMPELSPTIFVAVVAILVGAMLIVPRLRGRSQKPTTHDLYFGTTPKAPAAHVPGEVPEGAPRVPLPSRSAAPAAKPANSRPQPLKLP